MKTIEEIQQEKSWRIEQINVVKTTMEPLVQGTDNTTKLYQKALEVAELAIISGNPQANAENILDIITGMSIYDAIDALGKLREQGEDNKQEVIKQASLKFAKQKRREDRQKTLQNVLSTLIIILGITTIVMGGYLANKYFNTTSPVVATVPKVEVKPQVIPTVVPETIPTVIPNQKAIDELDRQYGIDKPLFTLDTKLPKWIGAADDITVVTKHTVVTENFTKGITTELLYNNVTGISFTVEIVRGAIFRVVNIHYPANV